MSEAEKFDPKTPAWLWGVLQDNKGLNFVQRIIDIESSPELTTPEGFSMSHYMAHEEVGGRWLAFPTVVQKAGESGLVDLGRDALSYALKSGEVIEFDSEEDAGWFSKNYKMFFKHPDGFDPDGADYDYAGAVSAGLGPGPDGHWPSRDPKTGLILKGAGHETFHMTEAAEKEAGMVMSRGEDGRLYSNPAK